jgi:hypothetical protein
MSPRPAQKSTRQATYVPSVKPARGIVVALEGRPGRWQLSDKAPTRGAWWAIAMDDAAKAHANYVEAKAPEMSRAA